MRDYDHNARSRPIVLLMTSLAALGLLLAPAVINASNMGQTQGPRSMTIPAGGSVTLQARAFCLDFGKDFPTGEITAKGLASDKVRAALNYAINKGYTEGNPQQVELAMWQLQDGTWHATEHAIAQEIANNTLSAPNDTADGISLVDAVAQNKVGATAKFVSQTKDNFYGDGEIEIKNLTGDELKVYMRIGFVFASSASNEQQLVAYETGTTKVAVEGTPVPLATAMSAGTPTVPGRPTPLPGTSGTGDNLPRGGVVSDSSGIAVSVALALALVLIFTGISIKLNRS